MSVQQYGRKISLLVGTDSSALDLSAFRIKFTVRRGDYQTPNSLDVRVYNVSSNTANLITKEFSRVVLSAGYDGGNFGLLFDGTLKQKRTGRESATDTYLDLTAADGDEAYNFSVMALSLAAGATPANSIEAFVQAMTPHGVNKGYIPQLNQSGSVRGKVFYGMTRDELRDFANQNGCGWSIQDGKLTVIPLRGYIPGEVPVLSSATGLIGIPEQTQQGINMRVLLNPTIKIGQTVKLDNTTVNQMRFGLDQGSQAQNQALSQQVKTNVDGLYYVMCADHYGDTRGNEWFTDLICLAVDATITQNVQGQAAILPEAAAIKIN